MDGRNDGDVIGARAADWAARLDRGPLSLAEQQALTRWAQADIRHRGALARAIAMLALFDRPKGPGPPTG